MSADELKEYFCTADVAEITGHDPGCRPTRTSGADRAGPLPGGCGRRHPRPVRGVRRTPTGWRRSMASSAFELVRSEKEIERPHRTVHARRGRPWSPASIPDVTICGRHRRLRTPRHGPVQRGLALPRRPPAHRGRGDAGARRWAPSSQHRAATTPPSTRPRSTRSDVATAVAATSGKHMKAVDGGRLPADRAAGGLPPVPRLHRLGQGRAD